jgi:NAD(P)-dependent dehydrogenase (short-subunit alcohol dehydrogenase family)
MSVFESSIFKGRQFVITGASSGIGRQCAIAVSKLGGTVLLLGRNERRLQETILMMEGRSHSFMASDVRESELIEGSIREFIASNGKISGFLHSAGIDSTAPLQALSLQDLHETFSVNVYAGFQLTKILTKRAYRDASMSIVYMASVMGFLGEPGKTAYCSSKAAIIAGVKAMALELCKKDIRINAISPAIVRTPLVSEMFDKLANESVAKIVEKHPSGIGAPEDVANAVIFLFSSASKWMTGQNLVLDGGYSLA